MTPLKTDMIALGMVQLGDCLELMKSMPDGMVDMVLCDLPYGTTQCKWDTIIPFEPLWEQIKRVTKINSAIVLTAAEPFCSKLVLSNIDMFKYDIIWHKTHPKGHLNAKKMPMRAHENVLVFYQKRPTYNPQMTSGHKRKVAKTAYIKEADGNSVYGGENRNTSYDSTERYPLSVQTFSNADQSNPLHPTQKPVSLFKYLISTYTNEGDLVLDMCAGSGTTGVACRELNRDYWLMEKDPEHFKTIVNRLV